jgi:hypothetical protein
MNNLKLNGFLGIDFGVSQQILKEKFSSKTGGILDTENSDSETLFFNDANFAGRETELILFLFFKDKFCKASVIIRPKLESKIVEIYKQIKDEINEKYYVSETDYETYHYPYEEGDEMTETAISLGKAEFSCFWNFKNSDFLDNYISLAINENMYISIDYEDGELMKQFVDRKKQQDALDY